MSVLLTGGHRGDGPDWYRIQMPARWLRARGHEVRVVYEALDEGKGHLEGVKTFLTQRGWHATLVIALEIMRKRGIKTLYELDDDVWTIPEWNPLGKHFDPVHLRGIENCMRMVDEVVCSTPKLAEICYKQNPRVTVIRNAVPFGDVPWPPPPRTKPGVRIGWAGSNTHLGDLALVVPALKRLLANRREVTCVFMGGKPAELDVGPRVEHYPWVHPLDLYWSIQDLQLDVALAPLVDVRFNQAKSSVKVLEAAACGLPIVASDVGPYRCVQNGVTGFRIKDNRADLWQSVLLQLVLDEPLRHRLGAEARAWALANTSMDQVGPLWAQVFNLEAPA